MKNTEEMRSHWTAPVKGALVSLGIYLAGTSVLAWAAWAGVLSEGGAPLAAIGFLAAFLGGVWGRGRNGSARNALVSSFLFALILSAVGLAWQRELAWRGGGGMILLSILAGGALASLLRRRRGRKKNRRFH